MDSKDSAPKRWRTIFIVITVVVVAAAVIAMIVSSNSGSPDDEDSIAVPARRGVPPRKARPGEPATEPVAYNKENAPPVKRGDYDNPIRLIAHYSGADDRTAARERLEQARQRLGAGEDPNVVVPELSDPPRVIPSELLDQYRELQPGQMSEILAIDDAFVLFVGETAQD